MSKAIRDGKVAILYSPGYGSGWVTCNYGNYQEFLLHDEKIVELVETDQRHKIEEYVNSIYPEVYCGGAPDLKVEWVPQGTLFRINEYDGNESIVFNSDDYWNVA